MRIVLFGLPYSPNVGDGIIAECLSYALERRLPGVEIVAIDIAGRHGFGETTLKDRTAALRLLKHLPATMRQALVMAVLGRRLDRVEQGWSDAAEGAALAVIGGGQLFSDADLNFCLKISRVAKVIRDAGVPAAIYAVGVSHNWSRKGGRLFMDVAVTDLRAVGVRDEYSLAAWRAQTAGALPPLPPAALTLDPGLLAAERYGSFRQIDGRIGICVTSPQILAYHADRNVAGAGGATFFVRLAEALVARGHRVSLFCNGAEEDRRTVELILDLPELEPGLAGGRIEICPPAGTPAELARSIAGFSAVIAHRLHACIVAYSYALPVIGLGWDRKVESFFDMIGARRQFLGDAAAEPSRVADLLDEALTQGVDPVTHARVVREAWDGIDLIIRCAGLTGEAMA